MTETLEARQSRINTEFNTLSLRARAGDGTLNERTGEIALIAATAINVMNVALSSENVTKAEEAIGKLRNQLNGASPAGQPANDPTANMPPAPPVPADDSAADVKASLREVLNDPDLSLNKKLNEQRTELDDHNGRLNDHEGRIAALENGGYTTTAGGDSFRWLWALAAFVVVGIVAFIVLGTSGGFTSTVMGTSAVTASIAGILGGITPVVFKKINKKGA